MGVRSVCVGGAGKGWLWSPGPFQALPPPARGMALSNKPKRTFSKQKVG